MNILLLLLSFVGFIINLDSPAELSSANKLFLVIEFVAVLVVGRIIIYRVLSDVKHSYCEKLYGCFLLFLFLSLLFLRYCWTPFLSVSNPDWGFDPQRFYYYASQMIQTPGFEVGLNYSGIVYFYALLMTILGIDPMVPLFINVLLVALTIAFLTKGIYKTYGENSYYRYTFLFFFLPEIIYYSAISSREVFCLVLVSFAIYNAVMSEGNSSMELLVSLICILTLLFLRPPFAAILVLALLFSPMRKNNKIVIVGIMAVFLSVYMVGKQNVGTQFDSAVLAESLSDHVSGKIEASDSFNYGENSLTRRLIPHNPVEFIGYGFIRSLLYLIPRTSPINLIKAASMSHYSIGSILVWLTSLVFMFFLPSFWKALWSFGRADRFQRTFIIAFVVFLFSVGMLNSNLIHERYRLVYDFLLLTVWLLSKQEKGLLVESR